MLDSATGAMAKVMMGGMIRKGLGLNTGDSSKLLPDPDHSLAWSLSWAASSGHVLDALSGWSSIIENAMRVHFDERFIHAIGDQINNWTGGTAPSDDLIYAGVKDLFSDSDQPYAEIALCVVYSPYKVTDRMLEEALQKNGSRPALLVLVAWAAQRAARRCGDWSASAGNL